MGVGTARIFKNVCNVLRVSFYFKEIRMINVWISVSILTIPQNRIA